jgi:hypothetical protein
LLARQIGGCEKNFAQLASTTAFAASETTKTRESVQTIRGAGATTALQQRFERCLKIVLWIEFGAARRPREGSASSRQDA